MQDCARRGTNTRRNEMGGLRCVRANRRWPRHVFPVLLGPLLEWTACALPGNFESHTPRLASVTAATCPGNVFDRESRIGCDDRSRRVSRADWVSGRAWAHGRNDAGLASRPCHPHPVREPGCFARPPHSARSREYAGQTCPRTTRWLLFRAQPPVRRGTGTIGISRHATFRAGAAWHRPHFAADAHAAVVGSGRRAVDWRRGFWGLGFAGTNPVGWGSRDEAGRMDFSAPPRGRRVG